MQNCPVCNHENVDGVAFCEACGHEFDSEVSIDESKTNSNPEELISNPIQKTTGADLETSKQDEDIANTSQPQGSITPAKLIAKSPNSPVKEFLLEESPILVGKFDSDFGPVDIDLEQFEGADYISRNHAEIYYQNGTWQVKDLNSENGVFIKRIGQKRFAKVTDTESLNSKDEVAIAKIRFIFESL